MKYLLLTLLFSTSAFAITNYSTKDSHGLKTLVITSNLEIECKMALGDTAAKLRSIEKAFVKNICQPSNVGPVQNPTEYQASLIILN